MKLQSLGVTLLELLVAVLIVSILSSMAVSIYTGQVERARYARARDEIRQLEVACARYEIDTGQYPPTGSQTAPSQGNGWMQLALLHSMNGNALRPVDFRWQGPYINFSHSQLGDLYGNTFSSAMFQGVEGEESPLSSLDLGDIQILDPWRTPYLYIRHTDYATRGGTRLPTFSPFYATETYFNPTTFQIISFGRDRATLSSPNRGLAPDDVANFIGSEL